ncbi:CvpA family protein [Spirosoma fluviale]|uniref:Membrane protein required for colicin V production n=1 Tax=Spirosoma fluviale TaxID=1597977 RepID=A0A286FZA8_9BACT|nr:CvpA family protein [Spirosoma fluviale]SOD88601.1 membrane protein required for colicin V production [Spirosoma fluviale]
MNTLDILMLIPLAWGIFNGYRKGLLVEIVAIIAFVVAMIVGFKFLAFGIDLLSPYISRELARKILPWLGFSVIFFPTVVMINQMGFAIRRSLKYSILGTFDSVAGATVGLFTWVFGISVILWLFSYMGVKMPARQTETAFLYPYIRPIAPKVMDKAAVWVPKGLEEGKKWRSSVDRLGRLN